MHDFDVTGDTFQHQVIDKSFDVPVVVDFWAPWCGPCKTLKPLLEKLAAEYQGKFVLAKINVDENQGIAAQFGVRGIPSVKAIYQGKLVDEFSGALPETQVRQFITRLIPSKGEKLRVEAMELFQKGDVDVASAMLDKAAELDPENSQIAIDKITLLLANNQFSAAKQLLNTLPANVQTSDAVVELAAKINVAEHISQLPDEATLLARAASTPGDLQTKLDLANFYISQKNYSDAIAQCLEIIRIDRTFKDDIGRKTLLNIFTILGNQSDLVKEARKNLSRLLH